MYREEARAMLKRVIDLFYCWQGSVGQHQNFVIWKVIPHWLMWCLWRECNARTFKGCELLGAINRREGIATRIITTYTNPPKNSLRKF